MVLPLWRSMHSLNLMLPKEDRKAMLLRLYNEDTPLQDHSKDRFAKQSLKSEPNEDDEVAEARAKAEVKNELIIRTEGDEDTIALAGLENEDADLGVDEDVKAEREDEREDDILPDALNEELEGEV